MTIIITYIGEELNSTTMRISYIYNRSIFIFNDDIIIIHHPRNNTLIV